MKKMRVALLLSGLLFSVFTAPAQAAQDRLFLVNGQSADRVHLRARPAADSKSLGLYFTGTEGWCDPSAGEDFWPVTIGAQTGYMKADFLYVGEDLRRVQPQQPIGVVKGGSTSRWVNVRAEPNLQADLVIKLLSGAEVTVLGESATRWYYVLAGDLFGYIQADFLAVEDTLAQGAALAGAAAPGYEMRLYTEAPNPKSSVKIAYPRFTGGDREALNALVYTKVQGLVDSDYFANTALSIDYQCAVTLHNSKMVSMVFWGSSDVEGSLHPFADLIALNVDLASLTEVRLADLYTVDAAFEQTFFDKAFFPTRPLTSYDATSFPEMLLLQTAENQGVTAFSYPEGVSCFLKPEGIVLSMGAVHVTGSDHFEAQLRYADIQRFYRLPQNYWQE